MDIRELNETLKRLTESFMDETNMPKDWFKVPHQSNINKFQMFNPEPKRPYIILSPKAKAYIENTDGAGFITSGAEGNHADGTISHYRGNKIDAQPLTGSVLNIDKYAELAIAFMNNHDTAFINFEGFTATQYEKVKAKIKEQVDDDLWKKYTEKANREKYPYFANTSSNQPHLDIGIL